VSYNTNALEDKTMVFMEEETMALHAETRLAAIPYSSQAKGFFSKLDLSGKESLPEGLVKKYYN